MEVDATPDDFALWISTGLNVPMAIAGDTYEFDLDHFLPGYKSFVTKKRIEGTIAELESKSLVDGMTVYNTNSFEVLLREASAFPRFTLMTRRDPLIILDPENGLTYNISRPTDAYILFLIMRAANLDALRSVFFATRIPNDQVPVGDMLDLLRDKFIRFISLQLTSVKGRSTIEFDRFVTGVLFQLSFNLDAAVVPQRHIDDFLGVSRITTLRRAKAREIDPPRRNYEAYLVHHYQLAIAGGSPFVEFLSYYHIAEHFFEMVFTDDLIERVRQRITQPDFSYQRKKDISLLIKDVSKRLQIRNERLVFNEQEALRLILLRYVDLQELEIQLNQYDGALLTYYCENKVSFAGADEVDFHNSSREAVYKKLAARIYKVRNAIVHSKESEKGRFAPFRDDRALIREIPLMRFVGEQIIIRSSDIL